MLLHFLLSSEDDVLDLATVVGGDNALSTKLWTYVPGTNPANKRMLIVAHADTVNGDTRLTLDDIDILPGGLGLFKGSKTRALGGDDRLGCALAYLSIGGQHSVLVTTGEERGCIGARAAAKQIPGELARHAFAVEFDRRGSQDFVFYTGTGNDTFKKWLLEKLPEGWRYDGLGSMTDIGVICREIKMCGVNLSVGFEAEHTSMERVSFNAWMHARIALQRLMSLSDEYPVFPQPEELTYSRWNGYKSTVIGLDEPWTAAGKWPAVGSEAETNARAWWKMQERENSPQTDKRREAWRNRNPVMFDHFVKASADGRTLLKLRATGQYTPMSPKEMYALWRIMHPAAERPNFEWLHLYGIAEMQLKVLVENWELAKKQEEKDTEKKIDRVLERAAADERKEEPGGKNAQKDGKGKTPPAAEEAAGKDAPTASTVAKRLGKLQLDIEERWVGFLAAYLFRIFDSDTANVEMGEDLDSHAAALEAEQRQVAGVDSLIPVVNAAGDVINYVHPEECTAAEIREGYTTLDRGQQAGFWD